MYKYMRCSYSVNSEDKTDEEYEYDVVSLEEGK